MRLVRKKRFIHPQILENNFTFETRDQVLLANRIIHFIKATGLLDFHSGNLVLKRDRSHFIFEVIDTEPLGLFVAGERERRQGLIPRKYRVLIGLLNFRDLYCRKLPVFKQEAEKAIRAFLMENPDMQVRAEKPSSERWIMVAKIVFSFIIPLIPLLIFVWALIEECCCNFDNVSSTMPVRTHRSRSSPPSCVEPKSVFNCAAFLLSPNPILKL